MNLGTPSGVPRSFPPIIWAKAEWLPLIRIFSPLIRISSTSSFR